MRPASVVYVIGTLIMTGVFVAGCGSRPSNPSTSSGNANQSNQALMADPTKGMHLFQQNCASCHSTGTDTKFGPGLKGLFSKSELPNGRPVTVNNVEEWIQTGGGNMPSFLQLSKQQRADIVAYLQTLK